MKMINRILISLAMSLLFTNVAVANHYIPVFKVEGNKFYLSLENVSVQTSVRILDGKGFAWVEEKVAISAQFKKVFNLESLPAGSYTLIVKSKLKETIQPITITEQELRMDESKRTVYFQAQLLHKRGHLKLSLSNPTNSMVRIFVISPAGRMVYQDEIKNQRVIDKDYNLKQLAAGNYTVIVDNARETYTQSINFR